MKYEKTEIIHAKPGDSVAFHNSKFDRAVGLRLFIGQAPTGPRRGRSGNAENGYATKIFTKHARCAEKIECALNAYLATISNWKTLQISWTLWNGEYEVQIIDLTGISQ